MSSANEGEYNGRGMWHAEKLILMWKFKGRGHLGDLGVDGKMIFKWVLED